VEVFRKESGWAGGSLSSKLGELICMFVWGKVGVNKAVYSHLHAEDIGLVHA